VTYWLQGARDTQGFVNAAAEMALDKLISAKKCHHSQS
jgi:hypothetical protein